MWATVMVRFSDAKAVQANTRARQRGTAQRSHLAQVSIGFARRRVVVFWVWLAAALHGVEARWARPSDKNALAAALAGDLLKAVNAQH